MSLLQVVMFLLLYYSTKSENKEKERNDKESKINWDPTQTEQHIRKCCYKEKKGKEGKVKMGPQAARRRHQGVPSQRKERKDREWDPRQQENHIRECCYKDCTPHLHLNLNSFLSGK